LSTLALKYAAAGARIFGAELTVLHVMHFDLPPYFTRTQTGQLKRQLKAAKADAQKHLTNHVRRVLGASGDKLKVRYVVIERPAAVGILETIETGKHDLVVMGTHGRSAVQRFLLGSVTEAVVRNSSAPVFVVRHKEHDFVDVHNPEAVPVLKNIMCPVNEASTAQSSLAVAGALAQRFEATLTVLYIIEPDVSQTVPEARRTVCSWVPQAVALQCAVQPRIKRGHAAEQIVRFAAETKQDLIVLGAPGRHRFSMPLFGETTELVLRNAPVPVLVLPLPG
jgi:nucleotide-binding universal stress UspA family protein